VYNLAGDGCAGASAGPSERTTRPGVPGMARSVSGDPAPSGHLLHRCGIFHNFLTGWWDDTGLRRKYWTPGRMMTCGYGFQRTGWTHRIDLRIRRSRARCVPDEADSHGYWQSLADTSACPLTCVRTGPSVVAHVLLSSRSRVRVALGRQLDSTASRIGLTVARRTMPPVPGC
jgi:hypothetical protein